MGGSHKKKKSFQSIFLEKLIIKFDKTSAIFQITQICRIIIFQFVMTFEIYILNNQRVQKMETPNKLYRLIFSVKFVPWIKQSSTMHRCFKDWSKTAEETLGFPCRSLNSFSTACYCNNSNQLHETSKEVLNLIQSPRKITGTTSCNIQEMKHWSHQLLHDLITLQDYCRSK